MNNQVLYKDKDGKVLHMTNAIDGETDWLIGLEIIDDLICY